MAKKHAHSLWNEMKLAEGGVGWGESKKGLGFHAPSSLTNRH